MKESYYKGWSITKYINEHGILIFKADAGDFYITATSKALLHGMIDMYNDKEWNDV